MSYPQDISEAYVCGAGETPCTPSLKNNDFLKEK